MKMESINPLAYLKQYHSNGLQYVASELVKIRNRPDIDPQIIVDLSTDYIFNETNLVNNNISKAELRMVINYAYLLEERNQWPSEASEKQIEKTLELENIIKESDDPLKQSKEITSEIISFNEQLLNSDQFKDEDKLPLFSGSSIAKGSLDYWKSINGGLENDWQIINQNWTDTPDLESNKIDWGEVLVSDAKGAVKGFFTGLFGSNPLGGAAGGAVAASAVSLVSQILKDL